VVGGTPWQEFQSGNAPEADIGISGLEFKEGFGRWNLAKPLFVPDST
jgi:hypothetical protein